MSGERHTCRKCGRFIAAAGVILCTVCAGAGAPAVPFAHHAVAVAAITADHPDVPHLPDREVISDRKPVYAAGYPQAVQAPFRQRPVVQRPRTQPRRGMWRSSYVITDPDGTTRFVTLGSH